MIKKIIQFGLKNNDVLCFGLAYNTYLAYKAKPMASVVHSYSHKH